MSREIGKREIEARAALDAVAERILSDGVSAGAGGYAPVVVLMSLKAGEGVTTVSVGLVRSLCLTHARKTLLIHHDSGPRGAASLMGAQARTSWISDPATPAAPIHAAAGGGLESADVMVFAEDGPELRTEEAWGSSITNLRSRYDIVLVDAGALAGHMPLRWLRWADQVILVVDSTRTTVESLERFSAEYRVHQRSLTGAILNKRVHHVPDFLYRMFA